MCNTATVHYTTYSIDIHLDSSKLGGFGKSSGVRLYVTHFCNVSESSSFLSGSRFGVLHHVIFGKKP